MKIVFHNRYSELNRLLFTSRNAPIGDDLLWPFQRLRQAAARRGIECVAYQGETGADYWETAVAFVCLDRPVSTVHDTFPGLPRHRNMTCPVFLIAFENDTILPENWENLGGFAKVMSFARAPTLDPERFVRLFPATDFDDWLMPQPSDKRRFCALVAANKANPDPRSIYAVRSEVIETFSAVEDFDLYGHGWTSAVPSWRGALLPGMKRVTMSRYRFALCMENARIRDYVTEKLFDAMLAGALPVYWGAPNIAEWVDPDAYVDASEFPSPAVLLEHLIRMPRAEWARKCLAGQQWMHSDRSYPFSVEAFTRTILDTVLT